MRYTAASDTDPKLTTLLDAAQREPVFIERNQQEVAVLVSAREYDRLSGKAAREFNTFCDRRLPKRLPTASPRKYSKRY